MRCSILLQNTAAIAVLFCTWEASAQTSPTAPAARPVFLDQGWSEDDRTWFYTASQGSQSPSRAAAIASVVPKVTCTSVSGSTSMP